MSDIHKSLRLGDLLVEKGLISRPQLRQAIEIQQALQGQRFGSKNINARTELGEILIELGFISRHQLQSNLNWQRRLKATTAVMVFIAPLLTAACGGGASGSTSTNGTSNIKTEIASSQASVDSLSPKPDPVSNNLVSNNSSAPAISSENINSTVPDISQTPTPVLSSSSKVSSSSQNKVSSSSSVPKAVSSSSSSLRAISSSSSISSANSLSSSAPVNGSVQLYWNVPNQRENGDYLDITEVGGYELRYKLKGENTYKTIRIKDGFTDAYYFDYLKGDYEFQIATFDTDGIYSSFIDVNPS